MRLRPGDMIELAYDEKVAQNPKETATLYDISGDRVWFPNEAIEDDDGAHIVVPAEMALEKTLIDETDLEALREEFNKKW